MLQYLDLFSIPARLSEGLGKEILTDQLVREDREGE
jgi:hypothetical protein